MKQHYRNVLLRMKEYVKITNFCRLCGISQSNLSWFLNGRDECISIDKLRFLIDTIRETLSDL